MKLLIAESDDASRRALAAVLVANPLERIEAATGTDAIQRIEAESPALIILDWSLSGMSGLEVCMRVRQRNVQLRPYIIMMAPGESTDDVVSAFAAGADDCVSRPLDGEQLRARVHAGMRLVLREHALVVEHAALQSALKRMHGMPELVPICSCCKRVRDDGAWLPVDRYLTVHAGVHFTHGLCPTCAPRLLEPRPK